MRLFFHKLGLLFSSVLSVLLLSVPTTPIVDNIDNNIKYFYPNQVCEERLSNGYFWVNNTNIEIIERTNAKIKFSIPFGIEEVIIKTEIDGPSIIYKKQ